MAYEPLAAGVLAGAFHKATDGYRSTKPVQDIVERNRAALEAYEGLCRELGEHHHGKNRLVQLIATTVA